MTLYVAKVETGREVDVYFGGTANCRPNARRFGRVDVPALSMSISSSTRSRSGTLLVGASFFFAAFDSFFASVDALVREPGFCRVRYDSAAGAFWAWSGSSPGPGEGGWAGGEPRGSSLWSAVECAALSLSCWPSCGDALVLRRGLVLGGLCTPASRASRSIEAERRRLRDASLLSSKELLV